MAQGSGTVGWRGYGLGNLERKIDYMAANKPTSAQGASTSERDVDFSRIYSPPRGPVTVPYLPENPHHNVLPSISQLSDMVPMSDFSITNYKPAFHAVTQDRVKDNTMMHPTHDTLSGFVSHSQTKIQMQISSVHQVHREHFYDRQDNPSTLPNLNLSFLSGNTVFDETLRPTPDLSSTALSTSHPSPSSAMEAYHPESLLQRSHPCSPSPTSAGAPSQRPTIMKHNIHTHHCDRCPSRFTRAGELKRHYKMHLPERRMFHCSIAGCDRNGEKGFYRSDKFRDHQRKAHRCGKMLGNRRRE